MEQKIDKDIPNIISDLYKKFEKYEPYMFDNIIQQNDTNYILPSNSLLLNSGSSNSSNDIDINEVPNNIEFLYIQNYKVKTPIIKWPENLVAIAVSYSFCEYSSTSDWMLIINQLPTTLKCISISIFDSELHNYTINWPPNLEVVSLDGSNLSCESISRLPQSIKLLDIDIYNLDKTAKYDTYFDNLPSQLEILAIHLWGHKNAEYFTSLNNLPDSIQYLELIYFDYDILKFPSNLKYLELFAENKFNSNIVKNIKSCNKLNETIIDITY